VTVAFLVPPVDLGVGDRFELTREAGPKLQPRGVRFGRILADMDDCWKVRFDGANHTRVILKRFIQAERRR
jgi:hypothetical protein